MEEFRVTVDSITRNVPDPFIVIATQNLVGSAGTQMLPDSQLDRFMIRTRMGYPDFQSQVNILKDRHSRDPLDSVHPVLSVEAFLALREEVRAVYVADPIYEYVTSLAEATRRHDLVLQPKARLTGTTAEDITAALLNEVAMPVTGEVSADE